MKNSLHSLRRQLRWTQATLALTVTSLLCAATPAVRPLFLASGTNQPTTPLNLSGPNVTGDPTSGKAIAPTIVSFSEYVNGDDYRSGSAFMRMANDSGNGLLGLRLGSTAGLSWDSVGIVWNFRPDVGLFRSGPNTLHLTNDGKGGSAAGDGNLLLGSFTASGAISFDNGAGYSDGLGTLTVEGLRSADDSLILNNNGLVINRMTIADNDGQLWIGGFYLIGDSDGYLNTGSQSYTAGAVTPTGFLILKDGNGVRYRIPAAAAP